MRAIGRVRSPAATIEHSAIPPRRLPDIGPALTDASQHDDVALMIRAGTRGRRLIAYVAALSVACAAAAEPIHAEGQRPVVDRPAARWEFARAIRPGTPLSVDTSTHGRRDGLFIRADDQTLTIGDGTSIESIPRTDVRRVRDRLVFGRKFKRNVAIGAGLGSGFGVAAAVGGVEASWALVVGLVGAGVGAGLGALKSLLSRPPRPFIFYEAP